METVPAYLGLAFGLLTAVTIGVFYVAARHSWRTLLVLLGWLLFQAGLGLRGFYLVTTGGPPRFPLLLLPSLVVITGLLLTQPGRHYLAGLRPGVLTLLHTVRVPVELVLLALFRHHAIPQLMTFEGRNWDILVGLTAPLVYYLAFRRKVLGNKALLLWNLVSLGSLLNIVVNAILSAPTPFQRFAFEQPNVAILHFPFLWLPAGVVPLVLLAHVAVIAQLVRSKGVAHS
ncbi:MAG: hypothetical protein ACRYFX_08515 [Janthinobacterium lividum]